MEISETLKFEGCNFLRQHIVFSLFSGRRVTISDIHPFDDDPGVKEFESTFLSIIQKITNGSTIVINKTRTQIQFGPGVIIGGEFDLECGTKRCISYFLEPLVMLAPFCKKPLNVRLTGVTNSPNEISVDAIRVTWLPVFNKFVPNDENLAIKIESRGFLPDGGGCVSFSSPITKSLKPVLRENPGKVRKIRGLAYVCKVSPSFASRMIDSAKRVLRDYIADVYITIDQRKGQQGGLSPGFGLFLFAETTEDIYYHGESMSNPRGDESDQLLAEDVGEMAAKRLLDEIHNGGCLDTSAQSLASTFMSLCDRDASKFLFGPLSLYTIHTLRNLKMFFEQVFKIYDWRSLVQQNEAFKKRKTLKLGSEHKALLVCVGVGFFNINKQML